MLSIARLDEYVYLEKKKITSAFLFLFLFSLNAFDSGLVLGLRAYFSGSKTDPHISQTDLDKMGASFLLGNVGFVMSGEFDLCYIFDGKKYFSLDSSKIFGGLGLQFFLGVGQGFSGQISGMVSGADAVRVFVNVYYTPVVTAGVGLKSYLLSNRLILDVALGTRVIADPTPSYDMYNDDPQTLPTIDGVGTMIVTDEMIKKMNAFGFLSRFSMEYVQPIINTTELVLGAYFSYCIYKPKYITMPNVLADLAKKTTNFDAMKTPLPSFYLNSLDFGLSLGINFKVNP